MSTKSVANPQGMQGLEGEVLDLLHGVMTRLKFRLHEAMRDAPDALAPMEARCLNFFVRRPGSTQRDLVQHAGRDKAQIARLVKLLQERGLLEGEPDPADKRVLRLHPTEAGRALQRRLQPLRQRFEADALADFSAAERTQLRALLGRMCANVDAVTPPPGR